MKANTDKSSETPAEKRKTAKYHIKKPLKAREQTASWEDEDGFSLVRLPRETGRWVV